MFIRGSPLLYPRIWEVSAQLNRSSIHIVNGVVSSEERDASRAPFRVSIVGFEDSQGIGHGASVLG